MNEEEKPVPSPIQIVPRYMPQHPLLRNLPKHLKDPANYEKIQRAIFKAGASTCGHGEVGEWATCKKCQRKQWDRKEVMERLGFVSGQQYLMWRRVHERIRDLKRDPLAKYSTP